WKARDRGRGRKCAPQRRHGEGDPRCGSDRGHVLHAQSVYRWARDRCTGGSGVLSAAGCADLQGGLCGGGVLKSYCQPPPSDVEMWTRAIRSSILKRANSSSAVNRLRCAVSTCK